MEEEPRGQVTGLRLGMRSRDGITELGIVLFSVYFFLLLQCTIISTDPVTSFILDIASILQ